MKARTMRLLAGAAACLLLSGCAATQPEMEGDPFAAVTTTTATESSGTASEEDPYEQLVAEWGADVDQNDVTDAHIGGFSAGLIERPADDTFLYTGEPMQLDFTMVNSLVRDLNSDKTYGDEYTAAIMLWVNGVPQPYSLTPDGETACVIPITMKKPTSLKEGTRVEATAYFTPVTGKAGEILNLTIGYIYQPDVRYINSMTIRHWSHEIRFPSMFRLRMEADTPAPAAAPTVPESVQFVQQNDWISEDRLAFGLTDAEGETAMPRVVLEGDHRYTVVLKLVGPVKEYPATLYINTVPYETVRIPTKGAGYMSTYAFTVDFDTLDAEQYAIEEINRLQVVVMGTEFPESIYDECAFGEEHELWVKLK